MSRQLTTPQKPGDIIIQQRCLIIQQLSPEHSSPRCSTQPHARATRNMSYTTNEGSCGSSIAPQQLVSWGLLFCAHFFGWRHFTTVEGRGEASRGSSHLIRITQRKLSVSRPSPPGHKHTHTEPAEHPERVFISAVVANVHRQDVFRLI